MVSPQQRLVAAAELQHMLGVSRQRISQLVERADFPPPFAELRMGQVWDRAAIEAWAKEQGRELTPLPDAWPKSTAAGARPASSGKYKSSP